MSSILEISISQDDNKTMLVKLIGELDQISLKALKKELDEKRAEEMRTLVFDLAEVEFIASAGLAIFVWYSNGFKKRGTGQKLRVINCSEGVFRIFHMTMLDEIIDVRSADQKTGLI
ncbi:MAG: STAS domain-containing protein [Candidatus Riflebacteria bacterium]|nr:STAS domain-containing protein [Candidatus Riflebacteria bacterium]